MTLVFEIAGFILAAMVAIALLFLAFVIIAVIVVALFNFGRFIKTEWKKPQTFSFN